MPTIHLSTNPPAIVATTCFQTTDIDVAIYLHARAYPLIRIDILREMPIFTFSSEAALGAEAFYQGATVSAKLLLHAARQVEYMRNNKINEYLFT